MKKYKNILTAIAILSAVASASATSDKKTIRCYGVIAETFSSYVATDYEVFEAEEGVTFVCDIDSPNLVCVVCTEYTPVNGRIPKSQATIRIMGKYVK